MGSLAPLPQLSSTGLLSPAGSAPLKSVVMLSAMPPGGDDDIAASAPNAPNFGPDSDAAAGGVCLHLKVLSETRN